MTTPNVPNEKGLVGEKADAQAREVEARSKLQQAKAEAGKAKAEKEEISGTAAAKARVKKGAAEVKEFLAADYAATKADLERAHDRYTKWDAAREREFDARLDAADAQLGVWKAKADAQRAKQGMKAHDDLASLEEKIALARARSAEAKHATYTAKAQAALEAAETAFDKAYAAATTRYDRKG